MKVTDKNDEEVIAQVLNLSMSNTIFNFKVSNVSDYQWIRRAIIIFPALKMEMRAEGNGLSKGDEISCEHELVWWK